MKTARRDTENRVVTVIRENLVKKLEENKEKHVLQYNEAMAGYKEELLGIVQKAFEKAENDLEKKKNSLVEKIKNFKDEDILKQSDYMTLIDAIHIEMKVPRSYAKDYDRAIEIAKWEANEKMELSTAEFTCYILDEWDWTSDFALTNSLYSNKG